MIGAVVGYLIKGITHRFSDGALAFGAGVSLGSAMLGLILPSLEYGAEMGILWTSLGIIVGAISVNLISEAVPDVQKFGFRSTAVGDKRARRVAIFVMAIAMHNLPEGIAAGIGFGTDDIGSAVLIAIGIALQNLPEGMVIIAPMTSVGISPSRALLIALLTGGVEVVGTFIGYFAASVSGVVLPFMLAFAGGTMIYVVSHDMIPETHADGNANLSSYLLILGFILMLIFYVLL